MESRAEQSRKWLLANLPTYVDRVNEPAKVRELRAVIIKVHPTNGRLLPQTKKKNKRQNWERREKRREEKGEKGAANYYTLRNDDDDGQKLFSRRAERTTFQLHQQYIHGRYTIPSHSSRETKREMKEAR